MFRKRGLYIIILVFAVFSIMCLSGCSTLDQATKKLNAKTTEEPPLAVALCLGYHGWSQDLNLNSPLIRDAVSKGIESFGFVSVISIDGSPDLIVADRYEIPDHYREGNPQLLRDMAKTKATNLLSGLTKVRANDPEVDTLEALRLAVRSLESAASGSEKVILVVDTGLCTTGLLNFQNNLMNAEPEYVANLLAEKQAIPDFSGITVNWQQLGDVNSPQDKLSPAQVTKLEKIWEAIIVKGGGTLVPSRTVANPGYMSGDLPPVSVVELPPEDPIKFDPTSAVVFNKPQYLSEDQVRFIGDSARYVDPAAAISVIKPIADCMKSAPSFKMLLIGTTAGDDSSAFSRALSLDRASAVKTTLVSLGIPEERILTRGLGSADPWHIHGVGMRGDIAAQNRKVVLLAADSPEAVKILNQQ